MFDFQRKGNILNNVNEETLKKETHYNFKIVDQSDDKIGPPPGDVNYKKPTNYGEGIYYEKGMKIVQELRDAGLEGHVINNGASGFTAIVENESIEQFKKMIKIFKNYGIPIDKYEIPEIENLKEEIRQVGGNETRLLALNEQIRILRERNSTAEIKMRGDRYLGSGPGMN